MDLLRILTSVSLGTAVVPSASLAQVAAGAPLEIGRTHQIQSRVLAEPRVIDVTLPRRYATATERYPVLFVLDGEVEHEIAAAIARFYGTTSQLPPMIVVGIRNVNRMRDMTPPPTGGFRAPPEAGDAGGADKFMQFLADELIPWVDSAYRTAPMRVLVGHSLGGLAAVYSLTTRPALFTGYVVMEPSTWWNNQRHLEEARQVLGRADARRARVIMVNAMPLGVDTTHWGGDRPMVRNVAIRGLTHESMAAAGMLEALRIMFEDFKPMAWKPGTRPIAMLERYDSLAARVGYSVPIPASGYERVARMSAHGRYFEDAERVIQRMERTFGENASTRALRELLAQERATPSSNFKALVIPPRRPSAKDVARLLGRWVSNDRTHEVAIRAAGDTIIVRDRIQFPGGEWDEGDHQVIQVTADGTLEWGLPWFRGIPALLVLMGTLQPDGTLHVAREPRGWVPRDPAAGMTRVDVFRRASP
jgi:predicted alpha/beta superfamily hydrolase